MNTIDVGILTPQMVTEVTYDTKSHTCKKIRFSETFFAMSLAEQIENIQYMLNGMREYQENTDCCSGIVYKMNIPIKEKR